jgi:hypothetical protein
MMIPTKTRNQGLNEKDEGPSQTKKRNGGAKQREGETKKKKAKDEEKVRKREGMKEGEKEREQVERPTTGGFTEEVFPRHTTRRTPVG